MSTDCGGMVVVRDMLLSDRTVWDCRQEPATDSRSCLPLDSDVWGRLIARTMSQPADFNIWMARRWLTLVRLWLFTWTH